MLQNTWNIFVARSTIALEEIFFIIIISTLPDVHVESFLKAFAFFTGRQPNDCVVVVTFYSWQKLLIKSTAIDLFHLHVHFRKRVSPRQAKPKT